MQENQHLLQAYNLSRHFGKVQAVHDISISLQRGDILGLLGLNGAGKSTTLSMLSGILAPTSGTVKIANKDIEQFPIQAKSHLGYLPDTPPLYPELRVIEYLTYAARLRSLNNSQLKSALERTLSLCQLESVSKKLIGNLSKGFRQRVGLAQAIIHQPDLLILDEPSSGLDPVQRIQMRELIDTLSQNSAIIFSSHVLSEVTAICKSVAIIHNGSLIHEQTLYNNQNNEIQKHFLRLQQSIKAEELLTLKTIHSAKALANGAFHIGVAREHHHQVVAEINHHWQILEFSMARDFLEERFADLTTGNHSPEIAP